MRKIFANIFALLTVNTLGAMVVEIFVAGMTFNQSLHARLIAVPVIIVAAWPYGQLREWLFKVMKADEKGMVYKGLADILAFIGVQVPQYLFVLKLSGATLQQMITACGMVTALSAFAGRPTGLFLDFSRWLFRVKKGA
jgi:hypothetical protein